jgi:hypothetical protein
MEFKELDGFSVEVVQLLSDLEYSALQAELFAQPEKGKLIQETGGARKIRVAMQARGKSSGARVIYYYQVADVIHFLLIYPKNAQENLTPKQTKWVRKMVEDIKEGKL